MGFFSSTKTVVEAIGRGAWKTGTFAWRYAGKPAGKGMVWVVKKAAVDPTANRIKEWSLVQNAAKVRASIAREECPVCEKKRLNKKSDFCSQTCALQAFEQWSKVVQKPYENIHIKKHNIKGLYHVCGCNRVNLYHNCKGKEGERI